MKPITEEARATMDQAGLCPVCGQNVTVVGHTKDGRVYATCGDAFTPAQWTADPDAWKNES